MRQFLLCAMFAIALTLLFWGPLWLGYGFVGGDLYPYFFPQKAFFSDRLHAGEFPLWNNLTGFGYPVLGESQTGAAYPLHVVAYYLLDVNTAYNVEHLLHYVLCFVATGLFARRVGLGASGSILMAVIFTYGWFPPRACLEWAIVTGAWLPVALWCVESFLQTRWWRYAIGLSLALGLQLLAGHFHLAFITQLLVVAYGGWRLWSRRESNEHHRLVPSPPSSGERVRVRGPNDELTQNVQVATSASTQPSTLIHQPDLRNPPHSNPLPPKTGGEGTGDGYVAVVISLLLAIVAGFLLASVQILPAWELKTRSSRAVVGGEHDPSYGHLPPAYVSQLFAPFWWYSPLAIGEESVIRNVAEFGAPWHWFGPHHDLEAAVQQSRIGAIQAATNKVEAHLYCGLVPLLLAVWWSVAGRRRCRKTASGIRSPFDDETRFWLIAGLIALVYATGWLLPVARFIPGFNFFRGPGRYGIVTTWAIAILAGRGLDGLLVRRDSTDHHSGAGGWVVIGLVFWSTCGDLWLVSRMVTNVVMVSAPAISFRDQSHVRKLMLSEPLAPRLYCPGQNVGTLLGVSCLPVYLGIAPTEYADPKFAGAGMPKPTSDGRPIMADADFSRWLRASGVTHILSFDPLDESSWRATQIWSGVDAMLNRAWGRPEPIYLYKLEPDEAGRLPGRVDFITQSQTDGGERVPATVRIQHEANRIVIESDSVQATALVLKDLSYPGWSSSNEEERVDSTLFGYRYFHVPAGTHQVTWTYRPRSVRIGAAISLLTLCFLATIGHLRFWHRGWLDRYVARIRRRD